MTDKQFFGACGIGLLIVLTVIGAQRHEPARKAAEVAQIDPKEAAERAAYQRDCTGNGPTMPDWCVGYVFGRRSGFGR